MSPIDGARKRSPSSVMPCTAIATSPISAVCWCSPSSVRARAGRRETRPAIARPMPTDSAMHSSATMPAAREASHQPYSAGSGPVDDTVSTSPSAWTSTPPHGASTRRAPRSAQSAILASVSASSVVGANAVAVRSPVHAGRPCAGRADGGCEGRRASSTPVRRRSRWPPRRRGRGPGRPAVAPWMGDLHLTRAADPEIAAAVNDHRRETLRRRGRPRGLSRTRRGRVAAPAAARSCRPRSSTRMARQRRAGSGSAGRAGPSGSGAAEASYERTYPAASSAASRHGSTSPPLRSAAHSPARTADRSSATPARPGAGRR